MPPDIVEVEIYGNKYKIKQPEGGGDVREIAEYLDAKIRAVAQNAPTASSPHLVVLAALNICHEFFDLKGGSLRDSRLAEEKVELLLQKLETLQAPNSRNA